ncbi:MAG TPA: UDP-N-acetylglucosamine 2-epimerase (non-hydrolyzing) [Candidatus Nanoarchaeia archaeon]|nr:UDP-N-acetylglucosamine 2-epimerase (non-hydrolyzing) [Candidatus Nanoarchaeia archaeon]
MKIVSIIGARPQFIKEASLLRHIGKKHSEVIVHTGQHYDFEMSGVFFGSLKIPKPDYSLNVGSGPHGRQTGEMLARIEEVLEKENPGLVIVSGDTNTTVAGALAASKMHINIAHIESGMRSFDKRMPEEVNRVVADHLSDLLFCSTNTAVKNLANEGLRKGVHKVGDVMIDSIIENLPVAKKESKIMDGIGLSEKKYILMTIHRAENTDSKERLRNIIRAAISSGEKIVFPIHPRTQKCLSQYSLDKELKGKNIIITKPVGYLDMLMLEKNASKIITDSGGVQKEAYFFKVPCITARDSTEWVETVKDKWNVLVGADSRKISAAIKKSKDGIKQTEDYGNGNAVKRIAKIIDKI